LVRFLIWILDAVRRGVLSTRLALAMGCTFGSG
jgi:hypothetical protein